MVIFFQTIKNLEEESEPITITNYNIEAEWGGKM